MRKGKPLSVNPLGDLRAENDETMLRRTFLESPDFRILVESGERSVVVGRRGTGKSALHLRLQSHWRDASNVRVIAICPEEVEVRALLREMSVFGDEYRLLRSGATVVWKYGLLMEIACLWANHFKFSTADSAAVLMPRIAAWRAAGYGLLPRLRALVRTSALGQTPPERIEALATSLQLSDVTHATAACLRDLGVRCVVLIDRLDEGYEPDSPGIGFVGGLVRAVSELRPKVDDARFTLFLRDNIFRAVNLKDPDSSRDIEGQVLRLHWDEQQLFYVVTRRMRVAFSIDSEKDLKVWEQCTAGELSQKDGFRLCLRLTLYRPRDLLALLNEAFLLAQRQERSEITIRDLEATAGIISQNRLEDLIKEYSAVIPALRHFVAAFSGGPPRLTMDDATERLTQALRVGSADPLVQQDLFLHDSAQNVLRSLFGVGFVGVEDPITGVFGFCHDGKSLDLDFSSPRRLLIHPCYWIALGLEKAPLAFEEAEEINDEYEIHVASMTPEIRRRRLRTLRDQLERISAGAEGQRAFEDWSLQFIQIAFGGHLRNIELHPNKNATQRRDIVGRNDSATEVWRRIREDYAVRQVVFEVKNFSEMSGEEARQMLSYLGNAYGKLGFIITRSADENLKRGPELEWTREIWNTQRKLIVRMSVGWVVRFLGKLERPVKHDIASEELARLLDMYERMYLSGETPSKGRREKKRGSRERAKGAS